MRVDKFNRPLHSDITVNRRTLSHRIHLTLPRYADCLPYLSQLIVKGSQIDYVNMYLIVHCGNVVTHTTQSEISITFH